MDPLHARMGGAVHVDLRGERRVPRLDVFDEGIAGEARAHDDKRLPEIRSPELRMDLLEEDGRAVTGREHLPVGRRADRRELPHPVLPEVGQQGLFVVERQE